MTTPAPTLFDLDDRTPSAGPHVLMPSMGYACGGSILTTQGGFMFLTETNFDQVGCPECRALGHVELLAEQRAQQGRQAVAA